MGKYVPIPVKSPNQTENQKNQIETEERSGLKPLPMMRDSPGQFFNNCFFRPPLFFSQTLPSASTSEKNTTTEPNLTEPKIKVPVSLFVECRATEKVKRS